MRKELKTITPRINPDDELLTIKQSVKSGKTSTVFTVHGHYCYLKDKRTFLDSLERWIKEQRELLTNQSY
jgi:collagenase-like PrtC family protease